MSQNIHLCRTTLISLVDAKSKEVKISLLSDDKVLNAISEIVNNILRDNIALFNKERLFLKKHLGDLKKLGSKKASSELKKRILLKNRVLNVVLKSFFRNWKNE